jgi:hypothetical protein
MQYCISVIEKSGSNINEPVLICGEEIKSGIANSNNKRNQKNVTKLFNSEIKGSVSF